MKCNAFPLKLFQHSFISLDDFDSRCGEGWVFDPSGTYFCYKFNEQRHRTWSAAYDYCKQEKGDLIGIGSAEEQSFLAGQISQMALTPSFWIGANDRDSESGWKWSDGSAFKYVNWADGKLWIYQCCFFFRKELTLLKQIC